MRHSVRQDRSARKRALSLGAIDTWTCPNEWCRRPLEVTTDGDGHVVALPCFGCDRVAKGRCYDCGDWRTSPSSPYCTACALKRFDDDLIPLGAMDAQMADAEAVDLAPGVPAATPHRQDYAEKRAALLKRDRLRRSATRRQHAMQTAPHSKRCDAPGCTNTITYFTRPPKWCDDCWWKLAEQRRAEKTRHNTEYHRAWRQKEA